nr:aldehyde dehydrogenase family protein [Rhizobium leguminosarum]
MNADDIRFAIEKADASQEAWARLTARARSEVLWNWHRLITGHGDDLGAILPAEMGKPLAEAKSEISHAAAYV